MRKLLLPLATILLLALAVPAFADWELGMGISPSQNTVTSTNPGDYNAILNFHLAYVWKFLYFAWDAYAMPSYWVRQATTYTDPSTGWVYPGADVPGFLNTLDVGIRLNPKPFIIYAAVGANSLYLYGGNFYTDPSGNMGIGLNTKLGAGVRFGFWGVNVSGMQSFATWNDLKWAFDQAFHGKTRELTDGSVLSLNFVLYF